MYVLVITHADAEEYDPARIFRPLSDEGQKEV